MWIANSLLIYLYGRIVMIQTHKETLSIKRGISFLLQFLNCRGGTYSILLGKSKGGVPIWAGALIRANTVRDVYLCCEVDAMLEGVLIV